jgi:G2/mitotic-specific cyclin 3/4
VMPFEISIDRPNYPQSPAHVHYSGYTWNQLRPLVSLIMECCESPQKHHSAVYEKYADRRYKRASLFVKGEMEKGFRLPASTPTSSRPSLPMIEAAPGFMPYENQDSYGRMIQIRG